jgi:MurNAc alpha-1-phosphate uridylyltransferase
VRALILAAGRGERMRPLTDACPKPLLQVRGKPLIRWWLEALARGGVSDLVVNTAWLGDQVEHYVTAHQPFGTGAALPEPDVRFSSEGHDFGHALETAGGIVRALPWLAPHPGDVFWVVAGDIFAPQFVFEEAALSRFIASGRLAHLWLVPNPPQHAEGDFGLARAGTVLNEASAGGVRHTFAAIGLYRRELFDLPWCSLPDGNPHGVAAPLAPLLRTAIGAGQVSGTRYAGEWVDVGTPERLAALNRTQGPREAQGSNG